MLKLLQADGTFAQFATRIRKVASDLEDLANIPLVKHQMALIMEIQTDAYWEGITPDILENVRRALREHVQLIDATERKIVYTDFTDEIGIATEIAVEAASPGMDKLHFTIKVRRFLERHKDHIALLKLRRAEQLTSTGLAELEGMFMAEGMAVGDGVDEIMQAGVLAFSCVV